MGRRLGKFDLRPCPLRLQSSLLVLGCTRLMRSTGFRRFPISLDCPRIQFIDNVLNFPEVLRKRRTYSVTVQKTVEFPQKQLLDKLMTSVVVQRLVPGCDSADNCGGAAVAWGPCGDSAAAVLGKVRHACNACPLSCVLRQGFRCPCSAVQRGSTGSSKPEALGQVVVLRGCGDVGIGQHAYHLAQILTESSFCVLRPSVPKCLPALSLPTVADFSLSEFSVFF